MKNGSFWLGLGLGSLLGALAYGFSQSSSAQKMKKDMRRSLRKMGHRAEDFFDDAKEKVWDVGSVAAEKLENKTHDVIKKAKMTKGKIIK
ncbi:YtxH domain-containing protein [Coprobacter tertius]|uniref:YtxH domain-containing protein n=1 Tax=Coprobacter tertius TaxID=2944915 RepID=A0ABT1MKB0_9BACT|nr:YtxH domain-containing protein [Coprobacter tertius]MCP9612444.1 YtxH domain-containing protein [Coprobacter tertius]